MTSDFADIERRMQAMERRLSRLGAAAGRATSDVSSGLSHATDRVGDVVASALADVAERFRGGAGSMGGEAARLGHEAAKYGNLALRRLGSEVEHRPLVMLAVAAGLGVLVGMASRRG
jgi:hypothetical protein